ncbi:sugar phosphate isomerase/epimerase family protein [Campylobacter sp. MG1]|uniref:sugar phosphate isomerase/epimerase family protein n=1 Tax=Campylobacter sp. MG1 TaxID=2976332 RepID=UPI00226CCD07|nr:TIM barrel protein [Campylobacter sp. MG1]
MKIGLETESMHLWFQNNKMDIFSYIDFAKDLGFDGVIINIIKDYGLDENWGTLGSNNLEHLKKISKKLKNYNMYCEIDTKGFEYNKMKEVCEVASILEASIIRSYVPITKKVLNITKGSEGAYDDSKITADFNIDEFYKFSEDIKMLIPLLNEYGVNLAIENHEYQTSFEMIELLKKVNNDKVKLLFDFGNSMMAYEEPLQACKNMAPYTITTHCKDHIIFQENNEYYVSGTPLGEGNIDIKSCINVLKSYGLKHINIESCYPYCSTFKRKVGTGGVNNLGEGAFKIEQPLFPELQAMQYYYPQEVSLSALDKLLKLQKQGVENSLSYIKSIL